MGGLRRLLHELTVVGVAAAHYADLQAQQTQHQLEYKDLKKKLAVAEAAQRKAFATVSQLKPQLIALGGEQSVAAQTLAAQLTTAELELQEAIRSAETYRSFARFTQQQLQSVQSQMHAVQGAMPVACVCGTLSCGPDSLTCLASASCNHTVAATVCSPSSRYLAVSISFTCSAPFVWLTAHGSCCCPCFTHRFARINIRAATATACTSCFRLRLCFVV